MANPFTPGDLVISVYGDGDGSGTYTDNQASPITLEDISTSGTVGGTLVLPQANSTVGSTTEYAVSGEYGSSSEGSLSLSTDGQSIVIAGYAVNAKAYNTAEANGGTNVYGNAALAQSTSVPGGASTPVARVIADVNYSGTVDSSTALFNVFNTNNPRSVVTDSGSSFYISGQGVSGDATQGVFYATDGATSATAIDSSTDTRTLELKNGTLYVSRDSKQPKGGGTDNIASYGGEPTTATAPATLAGISKSVALGAGQGNAINGSTGTVNISPENFFFANSTTLYVADSGLPKQGGVGDGGLQKWSFANNKWSLDYTLSAGLGLVNGTTATAGTTGLIGLTGKNNADGTVSLYATNATIGDTDPTYLYGVTDQLAATTTPSGESFTTLATAAADTNIRGVAFAPQAAAVVCYATGTHIRTAEGERTVESLKIGDIVVTASGALRSIRWIGHRSLSGNDGTSLPMQLCPVRILAGAFGIGADGEERPSRELRLSPGHTVLVNADENNEGGVLVPIMCLINGTSVAHAATESVTYWHVELEGAHDILLAEGLPAESYLDWGDRAFFAEASDHALHNPDHVVPGLGARCRPVAIDGPLVETERRRLDALFAVQLAEQGQWDKADAFAWLA